MELKAASAKSNLEIRDRHPRRGAQQLPAKFVEWQLSERQSLYAGLASGKRPTSFGAHLPVAVTLNQAGSFPLHSASKGAGFTPKDEYLDQYITLIDECLERCQGRPWKETLQERLEIIRSFYDHPDHIDTRRLGLLEIFRGKTFDNLCADARLTLHYTGEGPEYPSFQINSLVEIVGPEDKRFQFIYLARQLFEHDHFHIHQPDYPFGYIAWVHEVYDKSPFHGRAGRKIQSAPSAPAIELKELLIPLDNSRFSEYCMGVGLQLAGRFGARITGTHVYAAKLHDRRFQQMEAGLPAQYQEPEELERQREVHDDLITRGLQLISDSYLDVLAEKCRQMEIEFTGSRPEGKNYAALLDEIDGGQYDLVILGARGLGEAGLRAAKNQPVLGSVAERLARRAHSDLLIIKDEEPFQGDILVAVDGSPQSFGAVRLAAALAPLSEGSVEAVAAYDPEFHTVAFRGLEGVLSEQAGRVFRFKEQERLHNEIIDKGIAKIYQDHLNTAMRVAGEDGVQLKIKLLEGKPFPAILAHIQQSKPSLLLLGRLGVHADQTLDLGATAENLLRLAPCSVLLVARTFNPTTGAQVLEAISEGVPWSQDALARLENIPPFARSIARNTIEQYARDAGHEQVDLQTMAEAREKFGL